MPLITVNNEPPKPTTFEDLGYVQVVRCKDCEYYEPQFPLCKIYGVKDADWFCADGVKKDGQ